MICIDDIETPASGSLPEPHGGAGHTASVPAFTALRYTRRGQAGGSMTVVMKHETVLEMRTAARSRK